MEERQLGRSELRVPPLCFGCNVLGWTVDEETSFTLLDRLLDEGLTFLDTADAAAEQDAEPASAALA